MQYLRHAMETITGTHLVVAGWLLVAAWGSGLAAPTQVSAAAIHVDSLADITGAGDGACTLREAITNANANSDTSGGDCAAGSGEDTITFGVSGTLTLGATLPAITAPEALTIDGTGQVVTISGNHAVRRPLASGVEVPLREGRS
jgi:CSLREA domain-containing protein